MAYQLQSLLVTLYTSVLTISLLIILLNRIGEGAGAKSWGGLRKLEVAVGKDLQHKERTHTKTRKRERNCEKRRRGTGTQRRNSSGPRVKEIFLNATQQIMRITQSSK